MKRLLIGVAAVAALVISAPVWAQPAPSAPPPGASAPAPAPSQMNRMPAGGRATSNRGMGTGTRAHHRRHAVQSSGKSPAADSQANQLNRQELSQIQSANPTTMNRMSVGGKATSGNPNQ
jgi:hypothetical protein